MMKHILLLVRPPLPPPPPPTSPPPFEPAVGDWEWIPLYFGACICFVGIVLTRQMFKLSPKFRVRLRATRFHTLPLDAPVAEKAAVALDALACWPMTVSEMVAETEAAHGMVFRALMVTGGLAAMQTDLALLSAPASGYALMTIGIVNQLRRVTLASIVGFTFAPSAGEDHGVGVMREEYAESPAKGARKLLPGSERLRGLGLSQVGLSWVAEQPLKELPDERRELLGRTIFTGTIHVLLACVMLVTMPMLELVALGFDALAYLPALLEGRCWACLWFGLGAVRLLHIGCIAFVMGHFMAFFLFGFVSRKVAWYEGFWADLPRSLTISHAHP